MAGEFTIYDAAAERAVIGGMLTSQSALTEAVGSMRATAFADRSCRLLFETMREMYNNGVKVDEITLAAKISAKGAMNEAGGRGNLAGLVGAGTGDVSDYLRVVQDRHIRRDARTACDEVLRAIYSEPDQERLISFIETSAFKIRTEHQVSGRHKGKWTGDELADWFTQYMEGDEEYADTTEYPLPQMQAHLGGYAAGELVVLAGYSGDGKSVMALQMLEAACREGRRVGYWSLEMPERQVQRRLVAMAGVPMAHLRDRDFTDDERERVAERIATLRGFQYDVYSGSASVEQIRSAQLRERYDVVIIDHLHRMYGCEDRETLERYVRASKTLALDADCGVVALAQLSRREGFVRPTTNQLRGTDVLTQEADTVLFVWRDRDDEGRRFDTGQVIADKVRDGEPMEWSVRFTPSAMRFVEA